MQTKLVMWPASILLAALGAACGSDKPDADTGPVVMAPVVPSAGNAAPPVMTAGTAAPPVTPPQNTGGTGGVSPPTPEPDAGMMPEPPDDDPRGKCNIDSGFPGDEACLLPPAPGEGFQIHIGPTDYKDPADVNRFMFGPKMESSECWSYHTPNTEDIYYQGWIISGRPGTHHIISTMYATDHADGTAFTMCRDPGTATAPDILDTLPGASKAYMPREAVAPENAKVGRKITARAPSQSDMHYFNFGDEAILREIWMNIYYIPKEQVEEEGIQIRGMGGLGWQGPFAIPPGANEVYSYSCPITAPGRIIQLLGHYHAHGKRFTAWLQRQGGERLKVFEMYDYNDPKIFNYDSIAKNPSFSSTEAGAYTGILDVAAGDTIEWECHIINDSETPLTYRNEVQTGEMCNLWGTSVGPDIDCVLF
jgi:hypothetical protein